MLKTWRGLAQKRQFSWRWERHAGGFAWPARL